MKKLTSALLLTALCSISVGVFAGSHEAMSQDKMDHSNMKGMDHSNMKGMDHSNMKGMDHKNMENKDLKDNKKPY